MSVLGTSASWEQIASLTRDAGESLSALGVWLLTADETSRLAGLVRELRRPGDRERGAMSLDEMTETVDRLSVLVARLERLRAPRTSLPSRTPDAANRYPDGEACSCPLGVPGERGRAAPESLAR